MYKYKMKKITLSIGIEIFKHIQKLIPYKLYIVGSVRREKEFINDIDIIVLAKAELVLPYIQNILYRIIRSGEHIISGITYYNTTKILIDFFMVDKKELPYALLQYTGPKLYNIRIRKHVKDQYGWLLNQYGIFYANRPNIRVRGSSNLKSEKEVINFIGTRWYLPKDR